MHQNDKKIANSSLRLRAVSTHKISSKIFQAVDGKSLPSKNLKEYALKHSFKQVVRRRSNEIKNKSRNQKKTKRTDVSQHLAWNFCQTHGIEYKYIQSVFSKIRVDASEEYIAQLMKNAELGEREALYQLALCYENGIGVPVLPIKAQHYCRLAAEKGHELAQIDLGLDFEQGKGVSQSYEKAFYYYKLAADQGFLAANWHLGRCYENGHGVEKNPHQAFLHYKKSMVDEGLIGLADLARCYEEGIGVEKSREQATYYFDKYINRLKKDADAGSVHRQLLLGLYFESGTFVEKSLEKAIFYYTLALNQNNSSALYRLARCYRKAKNIKNSREIALDFYQKAADLGDVSAQLELGELLLESDQKSKAFELFRLASQSAVNGEDLARSRFWLGKCYENGFGVDRCIKTACYYYELSSQEGNLDALCRLAKAHLCGELGLELSIEKCLAYYHTAADQGDLEARSFLAKAYAEGRGVQKSPEKALQFNKDIFNSFHKLADKNDAWAQANLGHLFETGSGVGASIEKAIEYYTLAANQNEPLGQYYLAECYEYGKGVEPSQEKALHYYQLAVDQGLKCAKIALTRLSNGKIPNA